MTVRPLARVAAAAAAVLTASSVLFLTAPTATAAETDYLCQELSSPGPGAVMGRDCETKAGNPDRPYLLYLSGQTEPEFARENVIPSEDAIIGVECG
ncbi:hypothetical protein [Streptomyces sp. NPDC007205]|uniref:hypothetical protein n=1 Tax=Streptomyces sp. NPDC007205 TaxID=3154316 RepID=UPI0033E856D3